MIGFYHIKDGMSVCYNQLAKLDFQIGKTESAIAFSTQSKKNLLLAGYVFKDNGPFKCFHFFKQGSFLFNKGVDFGTLFVEI